MNKEELKILFLAPEAVPYAKTGGLADVAGSLPMALKRMGMDVRSVLPFYRNIREGHFDVSPSTNELEVPLGKALLKSRVLEARTKDDVPFYFIDREDLYDRPHLYGDPTGDYYDNLERFTFFAHAALRLIGKVGFIPDIVHCHDWQTGLIPALLKGPYERSPGLSQISTLFTIHNMGYQGIFPEEKMAVTGLDKETFFHINGVEFWGDISLLKAGIMYADAVTTVSPKYVQEIQTSEFGMGMEGILQGRHEDLHGILNGVDYSLWDTENDRHIAASYSWDKMAGKSRCKEALIKEMNIDKSILSRPLLGVISRFDSQKGFGLLMEVLEDLLALDVGLVFLGAGDETIQKEIEQAADLHPGKVGLFIGLNDSLAHRIMAGADIFLIPSRYEPCGLTQMYALRYGTVPVVRATGGLEDTVVSFDAETSHGNGFKFGPFEATAFLGAVKQAVNCYSSPGVWKRLVLNGMREDFSWDKSARKYIELYRSMIKM
ncbi:MAG: glycogen synthase GlgA [Desulfatiglans sp.]|nr:glycogen synthase GlgA [Thermodesulfobacteriota bacterium]MEE4352290.1 glycogen synthase GlgA [Desulfatiglans sp.]